MKKWIEIASVKIIEELQKSTVLKEYKYVKSRKRFIKKAGAISSSISINFSSCSLYIFCYHFLVRNNLLFVFTALFLVELCSF